MGGDVSSHASAGGARDPTNSALSQPGILDAEQPDHLAFTTDLRAWKILGELIYFVDQDLVGGFHDLALLTF